MHLSGILFEVNAMNGMRNRMSLFSAAAIALGFATVASPACAGAIGGTLVTNFTFDDLAIGSTPPQTFPGVDSQPQDQIYAIGGFPDSGTVTGTVTVQNAGSLSKAAQMSTTQGGIGALYVDTQFGTSGAKVDVAFDLVIVAAPSSGVPQNGQAFVIQSFGASPTLGVGRVFRFAATPTSDTGGTFGLRNNTDGAIVTIGSYDEGMAYHIELQVDFATQTLDALIDGMLVANDFALVSDTTSILEHFIFLNGVDGQTNTAAFDNLVTIGDVVAFSVPEPATLTLLGFGALGAGLARRRRRG
jgi:hypothetical protein